LGEQLASNELRRPLYLESSQTAGDLKGEIYATFEHPYSTVNVKYCEASRAGGADTLYGKPVYIGNVRGVVGRNTAPDGRRQEMTQGLGWRPSAEPRRISPGGCTGKLPSQLHHGLRQ
jgi:hypothetical protein